MKLRVWLWLLVAGCSGSDEPRAAVPGVPDAPTSETQTAPLILRTTEAFKGDWVAIRERGVLRVLVTHNRTNFFVANGKVRGFEYEMFRELEKGWPRRPPLRVAFIPVPFSDLIPALLAGRGDVAASALTVTPERAKRVAFTDPYRTDVAEILVAHRDAPPVSGWKGIRVHVVAGTSYVEHLRDKPVKIETLGRGLATEDALEMVNSGAFSYTVADRYLAELWAQVLPNLTLHPDIAAARGGTLAWAVRKDNPKLRAVLNRFIEKNRKGTLIGNVLFKRYYANTTWTKNPLLDVGRSRLAAFLEPLQRHCKTYKFDWRLIAAQVYQESQFDPNAVSRSGAVGLMQLLPATAKDMGVTNLHDPGENLRAGIKYMDWLRKNYFSDPAIPEAARTDLALAAYNCGPGRVRQLRRTAKKRGLDPNVWFGNVETVALDVVGMEPVRYVGNINKYFVVLSLLLDDMELRTRR